MRLEFFKRPAPEQALIIQETAARRGLLPVMVEKDWKSRFFAASWARYDLATPGTFRLAPPEFRLTELKKDYQAMQDMFLTTPPSFESVMKTVSDLEHQINGRSSS